MLISLDEPISHSPNQWEASARAIYKAGGEGEFEERLYQGSDEGLAQRVYFEACLARAVFPIMDLYLRGDHFDYSIFQLSPKQEEAGAPSSQTPFSWLYAWPDHPWHGWQKCFLDSPKLCFYDEHGRERRAKTTLSPQEMALVESGKNLLELAERHEWSAEAARSLSDAIELAFALGQAPANASQKSERL